MGRATWGGAHREVHTAGKFISRKAHKKRDTWEGAHREDTGYVSVFIVIFFIIITSPYVLVTCWHTHLSSNMHHCKFFVASV